MATNTIQAAIIPITVSFSGRKIDIAVPMAIPLAEILPGIVDEFGRLTPNSASQGFRLITHTGDYLDQGQSLAEQRVRAGSVLTLELTGTTASDDRYDDLVEAIGKAVESTRTPWTRGDSVQLSAYSAASLLVVAAGMLLMSGLSPLVVAVIGFAGAATVALGAAVVARIPAPGPSISLVVAACCLAGVGGFSLYPEFGIELQLMLAGFGVLLGSVAVVLLRNEDRPCAFGPLLVGLALIAYGALVGPARFGSAQIAVVIVTIVTVISVLTAWVGLAQVPARIEALTLSSLNPAESAVVTSQVRNGGTLMVALRVAGGLITVAFTPLIATTPIGAVFMICVGLSLLLGTRSLYGRHEVLVGLVSGMLTVVLTGLVSSLNHPEFMPVIIGVTIGIAVLVLANNVISVKLRPVLNRLADTAQVIALIAVLPLAALVWGVI
jgi:type VII secretion integral membrane protein EccD